MISLQGNAEQVKLTAASQSYSWPPPSHPHPFITSPLRQNNMKQSTTIHALPPEILSKIFENFRCDLLFLFRFTLVHPFWTTRATELLYRDIYIQSEKKALTIAFELRNIRKHLEKTETMYIACRTWAPEVGVFLRACVSLKELDFTDLVGVPLNILQYPSLKSRFFIVYVPRKRTRPSFFSPALKVLGMDCQYEPTTSASEELLTGSAAAPTQLRSLSVSLHDLYTDSNLSFVRNLVRTCLASPDPKLKRFEIISGHEHLTSLLPLASNITSSNLNSNWGLPFTLDSTTAFLRRATHLSHLALDATGELSDLLESLKCRLNTLTIECRDLEADEYNEMFSVIRKGAEGASSLFGSLRRLGFIGIGSRSFCGARDLDELVVALEKNGTRVIWEEMIE